jgi:hypothetical protein
MRGNIFVPDSDDIGVEAMHFDMCHLHRNVSFELEDFGWFRRPHSRLSFNAVDGGAGVFVNEDSVTGAFVEVNEIHSGSGAFGM